MRFEPHNHLLFVLPGCRHEPVMPPATACFQLNAEPALAGQELVFENCALGADRYEWDFGDGTVSDDPKPVHQYQKEGKYKIVQRVYSDDAYDMKFDTVTIGGYVLKSIEITEYKSCDGILMFKKMSDYYDSPHAKLGCPTVPAPVSFSSPVKVDYNTRIWIMKRYSNYDPELGVTTYREEFYSSVALDLAKSLKYTDLIIDSDGVFFRFNVEFAVADMER